MSSVLWRPGYRTWIGAFCVAMSLAAACGLRTPPHPIEDTAPIVGGNVEATLEDGAVVLRWPRAERSANGERLYDLTAFIVERSRAGAPFERIATIDVVDQEKIRRRSRFEYRDGNPGRGPLAYRVLAVTAEGQEGPPTPPVSVDPAAAQHAPAPQAATEAAPR